jgi:hypothetical protein
MNRVFLIGIFILLTMGACGSLEITRRYHNRGFQIGFAQRDKKNHALPKREKNINPKISSNVPSMNQSQSQPMVEEAETLVSERQTSPAFADLELKSTTPSVKTALTAKKQFIHYGKIHQNNAEKQVKQSFKKMAPQDNPDEGSIKWILYLILCIFIPPLAYYLIKRSADTLFWICLICFLFAFTLFGGSRIGLLGLISIVIALLALFNV